MEREAPESRRSSPALPTRAKQLLEELLAAGDEGTLRVDYEAREMIALMVEQNLVEVEMLDRAMAVRLKRYDRR